MVKAIKWSERSEGQMGLGIPERESKRDAGSSLAMSTFLLFPATLPFFCLIIVCLYLHFFFLNATFLRCCLSYDLST
jgi:hypothetical protein